jgi:hypothetical protein
VLHVINFQGSSYAAGFYVNLGAHLVFLPTEGGGKCVPAQQKEYQCAFRDRLDPPATRPPAIWPYGRDADEAKTVVGELLEAWNVQGHAFFARYSAFPDSFVELVRSAVTSAPHPRDGLKYARLASELGLAEEAIILARNALAVASELIRDNYSCRSASITFAGLSRPDGLW